MAEAQEQSQHVQEDMQTGLDHTATSLEKLVARHGRQLTEKWVTNDLLHQLL